MTEQASEGGTRRRRARVRSGGGAAAAARRSTDGCDRAVRQRDAVSAARPLAVDYLVVSAMGDIQCGMEKTYSKYWKKRKPLIGGHRGMGQSYETRR